MNYFKALLASSDQPHSLGYRLRNKRFVDFENLLNKHFAKNEKITILDVGGTAYFWEDKELFKSGRLSITLLNLTIEENLPKGMKSVSGDATHMPEFDEDSFDLVFSNSVIEHLYTWENQVKMAHECMRVGKFFFIQTPNKYFPVEAHYVLPFVQFLPKSWTFTVLTKTKLSRGMRWTTRDAQQYLDEIRLLSLSEMKDLFPGSVIYLEKFSGLNKSLTAHNL
ncbi:methyltransferase domain-containing protein [Mongoliitalea daihaiensis]|nr:methyltransferase domain-containing protein [Mongoliitalea daihaiensis]